MAEIGGRCRKARPGVWFSPCKWTHPGQSHGHNFITSPEGTLLFAFVRPFQVYLRRFGDVLFWLKCPRPLRFSLWKQQASRAQIFAGGFAAQIHPFYCFCACNYRWVLRYPLMLPLGCVCVGRGGGAGGGGGARTHTHTHTHTHTRHTHTHDTLRSYYPQW